MIYYISGPMTGIDRCNLPAFERAASYLYLNSHVSITPFNLEGVESDTYRKQLRRDLVAICTRADALYMLKGWEHSPGARAEHAVAVALDLPIAYEVGA